MNIVNLVLVAALILRIVLDLWTFSRSSYFVDIAYALLYIAVGSILLFHEKTDLVGYLAILLALYWSIKGWRAFGRSGKNGTVTERVRNGMRAVPPITHEQNKG